MNRQTCALATVALLLALTPALAASKTTTVSSSAETSAASVGLRYHRSLAEFENYPYDDGDFSYGLAYEIHDTLAYWQLAVSYAPDISGTNTVDYAITPELNLIIKDSEWHLDGGVGVLNTYMPSSDENADDWLGFYWHLLLGFDFPLGKLNLRLYAYYTYDDWGDLSEFEVDDLEYGGWLGYAF